MNDELRTKLVERADQVWEVRLGLECVARQLHQNAVVDEVANGLIHAALRLADAAYGCTTRALAEGECT